MGKERERSPFEEPGLFNDPGQHFEPQDFDVECAAEGCQRAMTREEAETRPTSGWRSTDNGKTWYCPDHADQV